MSDIELAKPSGYARYLATYIKCPSTIRARTFDHFGRGPSLERCRKYRAEVEEREQRERMDNRTCGIPKTFGCGHPRTVENTIERDGLDRCRTCRVEAEREAAKRWREKAIQRALDRATMDRQANKESKRPGRPAGDLIEAAAKLFNTTAADICSDSRYSEHITARAAVAAVLKAEWGMSLAGIGRLLGRDHSTVHHAINNVLPTRVKRNPAIADLMHELAETARGLA